MSELKGEHSEELSNKTKTPNKRTPSKRLSNIEKVRLESVQMIKNMGGSLDVEGGRKTRSSTRGSSTLSTPITPSPAKKSRQSSSTTPRRGRPKVIDIDDNVNKKKDESKSLSNDEVDKNNSKHVEDEDEVEENEVEDETKKDDTPSSVDDNSKKSDNIIDANAIDENKNKNENEKNNTIAIEQSEKTKTVTVTETTTTTTTPIENEKSEVDASKLETINENNTEDTVKEVTTITIEKSKTFNLSKELKTPLKDIVPLKETKIDPVEAMEIDEVDESIKLDTSSSSSSSKTTTTAAATTNNCIKTDTINVSNTEDVQNENGKNDTVLNPNQDHIKKSTSIECNDVNKDEISMAKIIPQNDKKTNSIENDKPVEIKINDTVEKKENESCEPKISSSPSTDGIVHTQTCN